MIRRRFFAAVAAATGGAALLKSAPVLAAPPADKPFSKVKLRMSAPLTWFPGDTPQEQIEQAAAWGLPGWEWLRPNGDFDAMRRMSDKHGTELSCMVGAGAIAPGGMVNPDDHDKLVADFKKNVAIAKTLNCKHLIVLSGNERDDIPAEKQTEYVIQCLKRLAPIAEKNEVIAVLEALNPLVDHRGYFVCRTDHTMEIMKKVSSPNVKMCFDIYHQQITEGNVIRNLSKNIRRIGHFHVADNPGRKEPGTGELNYTRIFEAIAKPVAKGRYKGFVALECGHSTGNYEDTLKATLACLQTA